MKFKILNGILIVDIFSILLILSIMLIPFTAVRVVLGLPFILFFPGYTLAAALFVKNDGIDNTERIAISLGMSIAIVALIGLGLNYTPWGIRLESILYSVAAFIVVTSAIALVRRARISKTNVFITEVTLGLPAWGDDALNKYISIVLIIAIFTALGILSYTIAVPKIGERFTEFYLLGIKGEAQEFPNEFIMNNGQIIKVIYSNGTVDASSKLGALTLGIVNHEQRTTVYYIKMTLDKEPMQIKFGEALTDMLGPIELKQGEKWENAINIIPQYIKDNQKLEFLLFKGAEITPINSVHLWINVKSAESDATLSNLTVSSGMLTPGFSSDIVSYINNVDNSVNSIICTPTVNTTSANIRVNGNPVDSGSPSAAINLNVGDNTITIMVLAEDKTTTRTYIIIVTRAPPPSNDATLSNIIIQGGTLTPLFGSDIVDYTVSVGNRVDFIRVVPTANENHATITVNGSRVYSGWTTGPINLKVGENTITIIVIAEDSITTKTYTVTVTREELLTQE